MHTVVDIVPQPFEAVQMKSQRDALNLGRPRHLARQYCLDTRWNLMSNQPMMSQVTRRVHYTHATRAFNSPAAVGCSNLRIRDRPMPPVSR
jgi:hypothetical protein